jgi:ABC-type polysaccharide/polyol phosphate transport system ATPase subunit
VRAGAIVADGASRTFRVHPERALTLKEALLRRGRLETREIRALDGVSFSVEPGESVALIGRNGSGKTTLLRLIAGIFKPTAGRVEVGGSVGALLTLGAGFHPDFTGRENVFLAGSILGLGRDYIREQLDEIVAFAELEGFVDLPVRTYSAGMNVRLGFAVATHLKPDILLLDEVFAVGDEAFQRKCTAKIFELKRRGGTIVFVSHDAAAVERLCERAILLRAGRLECDGRVAEAIARYHRMLADEEAPAEREAGLREWGTREVRIVSLRIEDPAGVERDQFLGGEALVVRLELVSEQDVPAPGLTVELRDERGALVGAGLADASTLGWEAGARAHVAHFSIDRLPLADGRFRLAVAVADAPGGRLYHRIEDAAEFVVFPDRADVRGRVRLDGRWSLDPAGASLEAGAR